MSFDLQSLRKQQTFENEKNMDTNFRRIVFLNLEMAAGLFFCIIWH